MLQAAIEGHLDCLRFLFDKVKPSRDTEKEAAHTSSMRWSRGDLEIFRRRKKDTGCGKARTAWETLQCMADSIVSNT